MQLVPVIILNKNIFVIAVELAIIIKTVFKFLIHDLKSRKNYSNTKHYVKLLEKPQFQREVEEVCVTQYIRLIPRLHYFIFFPGISSEV